MKHVIHKGIEYLDLVIIDGDIVLQSLKQDVIFENGYTEVCEKLKDEYWKQQYKCSERDYVLEYENEAMLEYIKDRDGVVQIHSLN